MTHGNSLTQPFISPAFTKRISVGAGIGLTLMVLFLSGVNHPRPEWGQYWMIRPLLLITFAGAAGATIYHQLEIWRVQYNWNKAVVVVASFLIFLIGLWLGAVLGMAGTLWN